LDYGRGEGRLRYYYHERGYYDKRGYYDEERGYRRRYYASSVVISTLRSGSPFWPVCVPSEKILLWI